jgi:serine protease Do
VQEEGVRVPTSTSPKRAHSAKYIASLAAAAATVLVLGFLLKPDKPQAESNPPLSPIETQRLARMAQRRALDTMTEHFSAVVSDLAGRVLQVGAGTGSGILWNTGLVVTAGRSTPSPESTVVMTPEGHLLTATRSVDGPNLPLTAYELPVQPPPGGERIEEAGAIEPGEWLLAVWHHEGDLAFSPGNFLETRSTRCGEMGVEAVLTSIALSDEMAGGGLFDLDGALVAVVLPCDEEHVALTPDSVSRLLERGHGFEAEMLASYGLRTLPVDEAARDLLGVEDGALVSEIWRGYPADESGLRPGDVIVSLGEQDVASPQDLEPLLLPPELQPRQLRVRRGRRTLEVDLSPRQAQEAVDEETHGVQLEPPPAGFTIGAVSPGSHGDDAGLRAGDRILRIDDREPRSPAELRRALNRGRPVFVEIERDRRRLGLLLP